MKPRGAQATTATVTYGTVLVPLDGSHIAAEALPHAVGVARRCHARLLLLHVLPDLEGTAGPTRESQAHIRQAEAYLSGLKRSLERFGIHVDVAIHAGAVAETIAAIARRLDRPLIILTHRGKTAAASGGTSAGNVAASLGGLWDGPLSIVEPVV